MRLRFWRGDEPMGGSIRTLRVTLTSLVVVAGSAWQDRRPGWATTNPNLRPRLRLAPRGRPGKGGPSPRGMYGPREALGALRVLQPAGRRPTAALRPASRPATVDDRRRIEAVRLYSAARRRRTCAMGRCRGPAPGGIEDRSGLGRDRPAPEKLYSARWAGPTWPSNMAARSWPSSRAIPRRWAGCSTISCN